MDTKRLAEIEHLQQANSDLRKITIEMASEIAQLRKALEFYADEQSYKIVSKSGPCWIGTNDVTDDSGKTAREALEWRNTTRK